MFTDNPDLHVPSIIRHVHDALVQARMDFDPDDPETEAIDAALDELSAEHEDLTGERLGAPGFVA